MDLISKIKGFEILDMLQQSNQITLGRHKNIISLERAIFPLGGVIRETVPFVTCPPRNHSSRILKRPGEGLKP